MQHSGSIIDRFGIRRAVVGMSLILLVVSGCGSGSETKPGNEKSKSAKNDSEKESEPAVPVSVEIKPWKEIEGWIKEQKGNVVVVDLWTTHCPPCKREFPHFVDLHNEQRENLVCVSLSLDYYGGSKKPEASKEKVLEFLKSQKATMANFLSSTPDSDVLKVFDSGLVPVCVIFDQQGKLHKVFNNDTNEYGDKGFSYEKEIVPTVDALLKTETQGG